MVGTMSDILCQFLVYCILLNAEKLLEGCTRKRYQGDARSGGKMSPIKNRDLGAALPAYLLTGCEPWQVTAPH